MDFAIPIILVLMLAALLVLRMPIGFIFLMIGFIGAVTIQGYDSAFALLASRPFSTNCHYDLSVVALFVLMGHLAFAAGITHDLYQAARAWVGHIKGGLVIATTMANAAFGAACGSTTAATAVFARVAVPQMFKYKVDRALAAGCVSAGGTLSAIIPPSVLIVIYGVLAKASIAKLLVAGVIPGILTALLFSGMIAVRAQRNPKLAPGAPPSPWGERIRSLRGTWGVILLFVLVIGGIFTGVFTPTEGGAIGAAGAFVIVLALRRLTRKVLQESFLETARTTAVIFICVTGTYLFAAYLALSGVTGVISAWVVGLPVPPIVIVIGSMFLFLVMGCILDPMSMMFLTIPIVLPIMKQLGIDPIWFGLLVVKMAAIGMVTPPMGLNCYMLKSIVPEFSLGEIFRGCGWFLAMEAVTMALLIAFPQITLWLPNLMF